MPGYRGDDIEGYSIESIKERYAYVKMANELLDEDEFIELLDKYDLLSKRDDVLRALMAGNTNLRSRGAVESILYSVHFDGAPPVPRAFWASGELEHELNNWYHYRLANQRYTMYPCGNGLFCVYIEGFDEYLVLWEKELL